MKDDFIVHNLFWKSGKEFESFDPHLNKLKDLPFVYHSPLIEEIPVLTPGIYVLTGGRQVGKSTTLKLLIKYLLKQKKVAADHIYFLPCDTIKDFTQLLFEIEQFRQGLKQEQPFVLFIDEVTYVKEWGRAVKSLADAGFFRNGSVVITGSDTYLLKNAMMEFPGRRGKADQQDFHLYPLSFHEYVALKEPKLSPPLKKARMEFQQKMAIGKDLLQEDLLNSLQRIFSDYLLTGGYLLAINDYAEHKTISNAVYKTYVQWIIGDVLKRGKNEQYLKEIIKALFLRLSKQITWHSLTSDLSIEHHQTIIDYIDLLVRMDVAIVLQALREDKLRPAPKKAKKVCFGDPFIFHALRALTTKKENSFNLALDLLNSHSELKNALIEGVITSLFHRKWDSYYIKAEGEVDLVLILGEKILPIEVKNSLILGEKDIKQILKHKKGLIGYAGLEIGKFKHLCVLPLSLLACLS